MPAAIGDNHLIARVFVVSDVYPFLSCGKIANIVAFDVIVEQTPCGTRQNGRKSFEKRFHRFRVFDVAKFAETVADFGQKPNFVFVEKYFLDKIRQPKAFVYGYQAYVCEFECVDEFFRYRRFVFDSVFTCFV